MIFGPAPQIFCFAKTIIRSAYVTQTFLYFDAIALTRYIFIFWLKNPAAFRDDFWYIFLSSWIKGASLIFNGVWFFKVEHQIINYYICSGNDPTEDFKKPLEVYATTEIGSLLIHVFVYARIKIYKQSNVDQGSGRNGFLKKLFLSDDKKQSLATITTNFIQIVGLGLLLFGAGYMSKIKPEEMKNHRFMIFMVYLIGPGSFFMFFVTIYFIRHKPLRNTIRVEIYEMYCRVYDHFYSH